MTAQPGWISVMRVATPAAILNIALLIVLVLPKVCFSECVKLWNMDRTEYISVCERDDTDHSNLIEPECFDLSDINTCQSEEGDKLVGGGEGNNVAEQFLNGEGGILLGWNEDNTVIIEGTADSGEAANPNQASTQPGSNEGDEPGQSGQCQCSMWDAWTWFCCVSQFGNNGEGAEGSENSGDDADQESSSPQAPPVQGGGDSGGDRGDGDDGGSLWEAAKHGIEDLAHRVKPLCDFCHSDIPATIKTQSPNVLARRHFGEYFAKRQFPLQTDAKYPLQGGGYLMSRGGTIGFYKGDALRSTLPAGTIAIGREKPEALVIGHRIRFLTASSTLSREDLRKRLEKAKDTKKVFGARVPAANKPLAAGGAASPKDLKSSPAKAGSKSTHQKPAAADSKISSSTSSGIAPLGFPGGKDGKILVESKTPVAAKSAPKLTPVVVPAGAQSANKAGGNVGIRLASVTSASVSKIRIPIGSGEGVALSLGGSGLDAVEKVDLLLDGKKVKHVAARVTAALDNSLALRIAAAAEGLSGTYTLRLETSGGTIDVDKKIASIEVFPATGERSTQTPPINPELPRGKNK